jgi:importin subunit alpha-1
MYSNQDSAPKPQPKGAKHGIDVRAGTKARQSLGVTIRQKNREEALTKRRRAGADDAVVDPHQGLIAYDEEGHAYDTGVLPTIRHPSAPDASSQADPDNPFAYNSKTVPEFVPLRLLPVFVQMTQSEDPQVMFHGVLMIRKLLSVNDNPPIQEVVDAQVVPFLVQLLRRDDWEELQFEAAWAVSNVASGNQAHARLIIDLRAVQEFVRLLESPNEDVREQAIWALGNIAGESAKCRDFILDLNAMPRLLRCVETPSIKMTIMRNAVWALSNLCRLKPQPSLRHVGQAIPVLAGLLNSHDKEIATDACWALSYISDGPPERVQAVMDARVLTRIIALTTGPNATTQTPAVRVLGNFVAGNNSQTQMVIDQGGLIPFHFLLNHPRRAMKKEACWILSNIAAGSPGQIQALIDANLFTMIVEVLRTAEYDVKKEAIYCICNATTGGTPEQLWQLVESCDVINVLCIMLAAYEPKVAGVALESLEAFLKLGVAAQAQNQLDENPIVAKVFQCGGYQNIEMAQDAMNEELSQSAIALIEIYFPHDVAYNGAASAPQGQQQRQERPYDFANARAPDGRDYDFSNYTD